MYWQGYIKILKLPLLLVLFYGYFEIIKPNTTILNHDSYTRLWSVIPYCNNTNCLKQNAYMIKTIDATLN